MELSRILGINYAGGTLTNKDYVTAVKRRKELGYSSAQELRYTIRETIRVKKMGGSEAVLSTWSDRWNGSWSGSSIVVLQIVCDGSETDHFLADVG